MSASGTARRRARAVLLVFALVSAVAAPAPAFAGGGKAEITRTRSGERSERSVKGTRGERRRGKSGLRRRRANSGTARFRRRGRAEDAKRGTEKPKAEDAHGRSVRSRLGRHGKKLGHKGFHAARRFVNVVGGAADRTGERLQAAGARLAKGGKVRKKLGKAVDAVGRTVVTLAGTETLRKSSLELYVGPSLTTARLEALGNLTLGVGLWTGSVEYWEQNELEPFDVHVNPGFGLETAAAGAGYDRLSGKWGSVSLPYLGGWAGERGHGISAGLPFFGELGFGEINAVEEGQYNMGPYVVGSAGIPIAGPVRLGFAVTLFYPPLAAITKHLRKPAMKLKLAQDKIGGAIKWAMAPAGKVARRVRDKVKRVGDKVKRVRDRMRSRHKQKRHKKRPYAQRPSTAEGEAAVLHR